MILDFPKFYKLNSIGDKRGNLVVLEGNSDVPFDIKRIYFMYGAVMGVKRGLHAHKELHQLVVCVAGHCRMTLDDGHRRDSIQLDDPLLALDLPPMLWHEMDEFSSDCILLVLANGYYDEADYVRDYSDFKALTQTEYLPSC